MRHTEMGKLAGVLDISGESDGVMMTPLDGARAGGHAKCVDVLNQLSLCACSELQLQFCNDSL